MTTTEDQLDNLPDEYEENMNGNETRNLEPSTDLIDAAPPEDLSDDEVLETSTRSINVDNIPESTSAGRLKSRVPDIPNNLIELIYRQKCLECSSVLTTISSSLSHYNSTKHQNKLMYLFLPHGTYNLPLSKEEIREIETGIVKSGEPNSIAQHRARNQPFRDLVKKFDINEDVRKLDLTFCRLCEMPFSSRVAALQHYSGKKHKKNADNWSPYIAPKPVDTKEDLRCDACNIIVGSSANMETHVAGKRHQMKMKAYLERMNAGAIAPPMSSRGFCDFNNVEREEANPVDPSRFTQPPANTPANTMSAENFIPANPTHSFLNSGRYDDSYGGGPVPEVSSGGYDGSAYGMTYGEERGDPADYCGDYENNYNYGNYSTSSSAFEFPSTGSGGGYGPTSASNADFSYPGTRQFPPPPWEQPQSYGGVPASFPGPPARTSANAPYAGPNFTPRGGGRGAGNHFNPNNLGPTKFKYNRK